MTQQTREQVDSETVDQLNERILDACYEVADEKGISKLKVKDVVERSGVSRQSVYNRYKNKRELLTEAFAREGLRISEACARELQNYPKLEDKFVQGFLYVYQHMPSNPLLREFVQSNREFLSYADLESNSARSFAYLCLKDVFDSHPELMKDLNELTEYWARGVFSLMMLPGEDLETIEQVERYIRLRLVPGLGLDSYQFKNL